MPREPRECHYCGRRGRTKDHVVPRVRVRELGHRVDTRRLDRINLVPACDPCNQAKGHGPSPCGCKRCFDAWDLYGILAAIAADSPRPRRPKSTGPQGGLSSGVLAAVG